MAFLPSAPRLHNRFSARPPVIRASEPEFLIEASAAYPRLEKLTLDARESLWFAFRIFDPDTALHHSETQALGLKTWGDLLAYKLDQGISFRLLLTDFDPVVGDLLHENTWRAVANLYARMQRAKTGWDMQVCPALHEARAGRYVRIMLAPAIYARVNAKRRELNAAPRKDRIESFKFLRGYHRYLRLDRSGHITWRPRLVLPHIHPVTHHHKVAVFDGKTAVLGGLDVDNRRYDDPDHNRDSHDTWHDVSMCITGSAAADISRYIADFWNIDRHDTMRQMRHAKTQDPDLFDCLNPNLDPLPSPNTDQTDTGSVPMQVIRTISRRKRLFRFTMRPAIVDHGFEDAYRGLISRAETLLYIETQFFRHKPLAEALAKRGRECETLRLILLLPAAPEEIAFNDKNGLDARYGERLQADCLKTVSEVFGERALFICPAKREQTRETGRNVVEEAPIIYVHAKVAIADDEWAIVGSANLNGRSLKWDSELGLLWNSASAGELRKKLATDWIDREGAETSLGDAFDLWRKVALENAQKPAPERRGFILPYFSQNADAIGVDLPFVPPEIV